jgi:hypothetical protein
LQHRQGPCSVRHGLVGATEPQLQVGPAQEKNWQIEEPSPPARPSFPESSPDWQGQSRMQVPTRLVSSACSDMRSERVMPAGRTRRNRGFHLEIIPATRVRSSSPR